MKAVVGDTVVAESDDTIVVEGNHYFPPDSIEADYFKSSDLHTVCGWKGTASYYDIEVDGQTLDNVAWYYPEPLEAAATIKDHVAFYRWGVDVRE